MTVVAPDDCGITNWVVKRDWRRDFDVEMRAEGHDLFVPNRLLPSQPPTAGAPITLVAMGRRPNGQVAVVVGTQTTIWRYIGVADQDWEWVEEGYVDQEGSPLSDYFDDFNGGTWLEIGGGFSTSGHRWEAETISGYLILNNGVDLPVTYQVQDPEVYPIYELREQGVASVGTITIHDDLLVCGDIKIIKEQSQVIEGQAFSIPVIGGPAISTFSSFQTPLAPLSVGTKFTLRGSNSTLQGQFQVYSLQSSTTMVFTEPGVLTAGVASVTFDLLSAIMNGPNPYGLLDDTLVDRFQNRVLWSAPNHPRRFAAVVPCTVNAFSNGIKLDYPVKSLTLGTQIRITGAGINGGNLTATVVYIEGTAVTVGDSAITSAEADISAAVTAAQTALNSAIDYQNGTAITLANAIAAASGSPGDATLSASVDTARRLNDLAVTAVNEARAALAAAQQAAVISTEFIAADMDGSVAGKFEDLEDDGSAVLKMLTLRDFLVVYTETKIFLGTFTGSATNPFNFNIVRIPDGTALHHRYTLVLLVNTNRFGGAAHVYAGKNAFYHFDLTLQVPTEIAEFQACQDTFFNAARDTEAFAVDNGITKEVWFCFGLDSGVDKALRWDYRFGTLSTTTVAVTAAATVIRPRAVIVFGQKEEWFVMGTADGSLLRLGFIASDAVDSAMANVPGGSIRLTRRVAPNQTHIQASSAFFTPEMIGWSIVTHSSKAVLAITGYVSATEVIVLGDDAVNNEQFKIIGAIWHRNGQAYDSILKSGCGEFNSPTTLKVLNRYAVIGDNEMGNSQILVTLLSGTNYRNMTEEVTDAPLDLNDRTMQPALVAGYYLQDQIKVSGINNPVRLDCRLFDLTARGERFFERGV